MSTAIEKQENREMLTNLLAEGRKLSALPNLSPENRSRLAFINSTVTQLSSGATSAREIREAQLNESLEKAGQNPVEFRKPFGTEQQRAAVRVWGAYSRDLKPEIRDQQVGQTTISYSSATGGGLVPVEFFSKLPMAMAAHSPLFDEDSVTFIRTSNGRPMQIPFASDVETVASVVTENTLIPETDISAVDSKTVAGFSYKSPMWKVSTEFDTDVSEAINTLALFERFASDRIARGAGADLLTNSGAGKPYGLIPSLLALGATTTAIGSATNDGSANTGANSVGTKDLANLFFAVPAPYRSSAKCAWIMNDSTALFLSTLLDKNGRPILNLNEPVLNLLGKPVKIDPNMPSIGASQTPIAFGDFSYWATRYAQDASYVKKFSQRFADSGAIGFRAFVRLDGCLLFSDADSPSPIRLLQNHS